MRDRTAETPHARFRRALEALQRPLAWERKGGFRDEVAHGGLTAYAARWVADAGSACPAGEIAAELAEIAACLARYSAETPAERAGLLEAIETGLAGLLARLEADTAEWQGLARVRDEALGARAVSDLREAMDLPVSAVHGAWPKLVQLLGKLGIHTAWDLLHFYPRAHQDRRRPTPIAELRNDEATGILVTVGSDAKSARGRRVVSVRAQAYDETGQIELIWYNQPWMLERLARGTRLYAVGKPERIGWRVSMTVSEHEILDREPDPLQIGRIVPVYPLTEGLGQASVRRIVSRAVEAFVHGDLDPLPAGVRERRRLVGLSRALTAIHFPTSPEEYEQARSSLAYGELLVLQIAVVRRAAEIASGEAYPVRAGTSPLNELETALPFQLTAAQKRVTRQILGDMAKASPMSRLLHGDVGSGKTVVIMAALLAAARAGFQAALMVPTEILAQQHCANLQRVLHPLGVPVELLVGGLPKRVRDVRRDRVRDGLSPIVVGTHALIQEGVEFAKLALVAVDEQHRFGVNQRLNLVRKGPNPHFLVCTATPIPRTLALTVYGHLRVSVLDEMPPGRQEIVTRMAGRKTAYEMIVREVRKGRQAYVVCPLIERSDALDCQAATELAERLASEDLRGLRIGLLHGRLPPEERDAVMAAFVAGESDVLVSTTVVEVGVDIPNATAMVVENAERFGLAQLHQLRGRVGRGAERSYCALVCERRTKEARERLSILCATTDGFRIAMEDLRIRGPGEFFGTKQSGLPDLRIADVMRDVSLLELAREDAERIVAADPHLAAPEHADLALAVRMASEGREAPSPVG